MTATAPSIGRTAKRTKEHLSEVAMRLFMAHGYENVTVENVAAEAGVSRRTVFRHFPSKDELPFPDHAERRDLIRRMVAEPGRGINPVEDVLDITRAVLRDFMDHREVVLARYRLTRLVPPLHEREVLEHDRYLALSHEHLDRHLGDDPHSFRPLALASLIDGVHLTVLRHWLSTDGGTDAMAELEEGFGWVRSLVDADPSGRSPAAPSLLAVLPDTPDARRALRRLVAESTDLTGTASPGGQPPADRSMP